MKQKNNYVYVYNYLGLLYDNRVSLYIKIWNLNDINRLKINFLYISKILCFNFIIKFVLIIFYIFFILHKIFKYILL